MQIIIYLRVNHSKKTQKSTSPQVFFRYMYIKAIFGHFYTKSTDVSTFCTNPPIFFLKLKVLMILKKSAKFHHHSICSSEKKKGDTGAPPLPPVLKSHAKARYG